MATKTKKILVTGDVTLDQYICLGERKYSDAPKDKAGSMISTINGGAYLIHDFLTAFTAPETVHFGLDPSLFAKLPSQNNSYATIARYKGGKDGKEEFWRIDQQFGFGSFSKAVEYTEAKPAKDLSDHDIVIIDDAGMDFGSSVNQESAWPQIASLNKPAGDRKGVELVICKKSGDIKKGELLKVLLDASAKGSINLLTIVSISDIRRQEARVSSKISWEQTALDLVYELTNNVNLKELLNSKFLVVTIQSSGAVLIVNKGEGTFEYKLIFDPLYLEDEWEARCNGSVIGRMSCFTAALTAKLELDNPIKNYKLEDAIAFGLQAVMAFFNVGYLKEGKELKIPVLKIPEATSNLASTFSRANIPIPESNSCYLNNDWTILKDNYKVLGNISSATEKSSDKKDDSFTTEIALFNIARDIVLNGRAVLNNIPSLTLGNLFTVDRNEIESLRNIKMLIENYRDQKGAKIPLSIAVFGLPGSGKSFGVKEIGIGVLGPKLPILEFNLSQFTGPADLIGAFHQVRDEVLKGNIPLVFWDEFDSKNYDWLQYLLAPMQDGCFQEGQVTHNIGKCIMVYAGGTSYKMETFGVFDEKKDQDKIGQFKMKKGPDFISRIHGYINILGPNPALAFNKETFRWEVDLADNCYPVRRSLFIRQILGLDKNMPINMDWGLLNALLKVDKYKHGARSLANLLKNLKDNGDGRKMMRCHLPSNTIIELYIEDISDFFCKLNENQRYNEHVFEIAPAIHKVWQDYAETKNVDYMKEFTMLPVFIKASNVDAAHRIPMVLGVGKLKIVPKEDSKAMKAADYKTYIEDDNNLMLEKMAAEEHRLWMQFYKDNDWHYNEISDEYLKHHNSLVDYHSNKLGETEKNKDRKQVAKYWEILNEAGFGLSRE